MRKFGEYPIVVNYNLHTQLRFRDQEATLHEAGKYEDERQRYIKTSTTSDSGIENNLFKDEIDKYELAVCKFLRAIEGNPVGRMVLGLINKSTTVWIVPRSDADLKRCSCAQTNPLKYEIQKDGSVARGVGSGDTVIDFRPELGDDTLFHELVHAYRYSYKKFSPLMISVTSGRLSTTYSTEEVFAHQMENIYMSQAKRPVTVDYRWQEVADKAKIYDFLVENIEMLESLKFFMRHEYLAMLAARSFTADYNAFRDCGMLVARFLKASSRPTLPELGTRPQGNSNVRQPGRIGK